MEKIKSIINPEELPDYDSVSRNIDALLERYPYILHKKAVGKSHLSRDIPLLTIGCGEKNVLAVAGIHGREYVTVSYILKCLEDYCCGLSKNSLYKGYSLRELFEKCTLYAVPVANPDGLNIARGKGSTIKGKVREDRKLYKNNARDVNLNANFPFMWMKVPRERQRGTLPKSEKETKFLVDICEKVNFSSMLSFHSRGGCIYWRDSVNKEIGGDLSLAKRLSFECGYTLCEESKEIENFAGGFENWFRQEFSKPALCIELVKDENMDFSQAVKDFYTAVDFENTKKTILVTMSQCLLGK